MVHYHGFLVIAASVLGLVLQAVAAGNRTIDDSSTEFTFTGNWLVNSCSNCASQPDSGLATNGTWHTNNDVLTTAKLQFTGSAIWLFGILTPAANQGALTITLDYQSPVIYNSSGSSNSSFIYNALLFSATSLSSSTHTLTLKTGVGSTSGSSVLVDYAVVNSDFPSSTTSGTRATSASNDPDSSSSHNHSTPGDIVGAIIGALFALIIIGSIFRFCCRPQTGVVVTPQPRMVYEETTVMVPVTAVRPVTVYDVPPLYRP
ncbi:hypothetical protein L218DRAFT_722416 [Marasmius fiardii PR-910]|nr:hypothetical protein L218DRAFT_722416 [Marasmius fiardii PR-910]